MLTVDQSHRYLLRNGKFFPYLADTGWTMVQKLDRAEIVAYLDKRRAQGYNAIQVSALSELGGLLEPNREGQMPFFENNDIANPNDRYFDLVLFVADECAKRGMVTVLLPTWGDKFFLRDGTGPVVFHSDNVYGYGKYLAEKIGRREDIIWMLGGDRPLETAEHRLIIDRMAEGLKAGEQVRHLMTYHPCGEASSADFVGDAGYIDFHTVQSSHSFGGYQSEEYVRRTLEAHDKPCIDAECFYEDFPLDFDLAWGYRFTAEDIRRRIYKNMLTGAAGHTYGHQSVWRFEPQTSEEYPYDWKAALDRPMAWQMRYINRLLDRVDIMTAKPSKICRNALCREGEGYLLTYAENTAALYIDLRQAEGYQTFCWFDPEQGLFTDPRPVEGKQLVLTSPFGHDGVLLLQK